MSNKRFNVNLERLVGSSAFAEASVDELRVILAALATKGRQTDEADLALSAKCSLSRCKSALVLWQEEGVITESASDVEYEYDSEGHFSDMVEEKPIEVAKAISREDLSPLIDQCAEMMKKSALSTHETALIVSLVTKMALSEEYIVTLLAYLLEKGKATALRLVRKAESLVGGGYDTVEKLEEYIRNKESESSAEWEFRRVFGIYDRNLSQYEKALFKKWADEFGYSTAIVNLAYDKATRAGAPRSISYVDTLLTAWHGAGCKTVSECEANSESFKSAKAAESEATVKKFKKKSDAPVARYGDFDVEEAFKLALERSYGKEEN